MQHKHEIKAPASERAPANGRHRPPFDLLAAAPYLVTAALSDCLARTQPPEVFRPGRSGTARSHAATCQAGFTLIEMMVAAIIVAILAGLALPAYTKYVNKSRAKSASADLAALALNMENRYQLQLSYPVYAANTAATNAIFSAWSPTQASHFSYTMASTASTYTLTATGQGSSAGCTLSLSHLNARTATSACGFTTW